MHHFLAIAGLSLVGLGTGCVSSEKYNAMRMRADSADAQLSDAESQTKSATATQILTAKQAAVFKEMADSKDAINANLTQENNELKLQHA
jgi:signal transduction histidine kinase